MGTVNFTYTGGWQTFTVPAGVTSLNVFMNGGGSGASKGGRVEGKLAVTPGKKLYVVCGRQGIANSGESGGGIAFGGGGAGGDGKSGSGGDGGGGFSEIRRDSTSGTIVAVAGGAGGQSGDGGKGGDGGGSTGESGGRGTSGSNSTGAATGGTQSQGGNGGTSSSGAGFDGHDAPDSAVAQAGAGGQSSNYSYGGGGGGGGWRSGGGGQAASKGYAPGGGGGGGSNYWGGLTSAKNIQGYATGNGATAFTWTDPAPANLPPTTPTSVLVNGVAEAPAMPTKDVGDITVSAIVNDPDSGDTVQLLLRLSTSSSFSSYTQKSSPLVARGTRATVTIVNALANTHYYVRLYSVDKHGLASTTYNALDFWTNRTPVEPNLTAPVENASVPTIFSTVFTWTHNDPDPTDPMKGWQLQYRTAATATADPGPWTLISQPSNTSPTWTIDANTFRGNTFYEWRVRTSDHSGVFGIWAVPNSFFATSVSSPPVLYRPGSGTAVDVDAPTTFGWVFVDPDIGDTQARADLRYRVVGQDDSAWVTMLGAPDPGVPGHTAQWVLPAGTFAPGYNYEWEVRTYDVIGTGLASDWSTPFTFWTVHTPGSSSIPPVPQFTSIQGALGCGEYRVYVYAQGGKQVIGEITPMTTLNFKRVRDDISNCTVVTNGFSEDCCGLYASLRSWMHELVVFRSGVRVWEGPITRIGYAVDQVEIEAKDVMGYLYRRILRQGFNDAYQAIPGSSADPHQLQRIPSMNVVERAEWLIVNALAPHDPNVLPYLTTIQFDDDAKQSRIIPDFSQTVWEQVDDMAATSGLDYTVVGRRIILWDTHRSIGKLPEMRDGDFSDPPIVTEYGMQLCNFMAVTNGSGVAGFATPLGQVSPFQAFGPIEMVATGYSDAAAASSAVLTNAAKKTLVDGFTDQAKTNISHRWPAPVIVRVPDNSTLSPEVGVGFDQLVPGVWIPLRSAATCREVVQWQKLDSITVNVEASTGEQVQIVMSPAPNGGDDDPDADAAAAEDS